MAQKAFSIGGVGATPTLEDVVRLAQGQIVALDSSGVERVKKLSPAPKNFVAEQCQHSSVAASCGDLLKPVQIRALLAAKLIQLMNGRSGTRVQVSEYLAALLNGGVLPALRVCPADVGVLQQVADACHGLGGAVTALEPGSQQDLLTALTAATIQPPNLSTAERQILQGGAAATVGIAALTAQAGRRLLQLGTATAALTLEALGAQIKHLDADLMEAQGYKAAMAVADDLRGMLEGSKRIGAMKAAESDCLPAAVSAVAQRLAAVLEALTSCSTAVRCELQAEALPPKGGAPGNVIPPSLAPAVLDLGRTLLMQASDAHARAACVLQGSSSSLQSALEPAALAVASAISAAQQQLQPVGLHVLSSSSSSSPAEQWGVAAAMAASAALDAAHLATALEALAAVAALRLLEGPATPPQAAPAAAHATEASGGTTAESAASAAPDTPADVGSSAASALGSAEGGKPDKKAAAAAAGQAKKKDKKGAAVAMVLGKGTTLLREYVEAAAAAADESGAAAQARTLPFAAAGLLASADGSSAAQPGPEPALAAAALDGALARVASQLEPLSPAVAKFGEELRGVVEANQARRKPKVPKGARDFLPEQMAIREAAFATITSVFKRHGAVSIDTPVFELRETLMGKYGEDSKLIYDLADQGGEVLSLRYDLTVPFARYVAVNGIGNIKRYHIAKVYRRDQPQMNRGRFREFFQCDFDIAGAYATMVADSEVIKVVIEILTDLKLGEFEIKLNHRKLLDAMLDIAGVPAQKFRAICSAIDKLDKEPWEAVRSEMVDEKGLPPAVADKIGEFVVLRGEPMALLEQLTAAEHPLNMHPDSKAALEELRILFGFVQAMGALGPVVFDLSLARGLDYYTGVIYEAVLKSGAVGSIAAGGRYDKLVGMFSGKDVPAVGVSIGIERVFTIMEGQVRERAAAEGRPVRAVETEVLVASIGNNLQTQRMELCNQLWAAGIKAEFGFKPNPKMGDQLNHALEEGIPFMVLFGEDELKSGAVKVKDMNAKTEDVVPVGRLVEELLARIAANKKGSAPSAADGPAA